MTTIHTGDKLTIILEDRIIIGSVTNTLRTSSPTGNPSLNIMLSGNGRNGHVRLGTEDIHIEAEIQSEVQR